MDSTIEIEGRRIGGNEPPYVIAELSANHNGQLANAIRLVEEAKKAGADAVKLQTYTPDTITLKSDAEGFRIESGLWEGRTLYELYAEAYMPWEWHKPLFDHARKLGITIFSSPFDNSAIDLLEDLNAPAYKIASLEIVDLPLIRYAAGTRKPLIISTGLANVEEISEAIAAARDGGCSQLSILHCVTGYPAPASDYNLRTIPDMIRRFGVVAGISDHTLDNTTALAAIALGASIVEKHFTLSRAGGGPDDSFSLEPAGLADLCDGARTAWSALGSVDYSIKSSERGNLVYRPSIYVSDDVKVGDEVTEQNVRTVRPGNGLACKYLPSVLGRKFVIDVRHGTPLEWDFISGERCGE